MNTVKKYAVATIDNHAISKLDPEKIAKRIDSWIEKLIEQSDAPITNDMSDDERKHVLQLRSEAQKSFDVYIKEQQAMFQSRGMDRNLVWTTAIVPTGDTLKNGVEICKIVKRITKLMIDNNEEEAHAARQNDNRLDSDKKGMNREYTGKFCDADRLIHEQNEYENELRKDL